jgi:hypothetical protein
MKVLTTSGVEAPSVCEVESVLRRLLLEIGSSLRRSPRPLSLPSASSTNCNNFHISMIGFSSHSQDKTGDPDLIGFPDWPAS